MGRSECRKSSVVRMGREARRRAKRAVKMGFVRVWKRRDVRRRAWKSLGSVMWEMISRRSSLGRWGAGILAVMSVVGDEGEVGDGYNIYEEGAARQFNARQST